MPDFTYDTSTDIGLVRELIPDTDEANALFTDTSIQAFLNLPGVLGSAGAVFRAAAAACKVIGRGDGLIIQKVQESRGLKTNGAALAAEFRQQALSLIEDAKEAEAASDGGFISVAVNRTAAQARSGSAAEAEDWEL